MPRRLQAGRINFGYMHWRSIGLPRASADLSGAVANLRTSFWTRAGPPRAGRPGARQVGCRYGWFCFDPDRFDCHTLANGRRLPAQWTPTRPGTGLPRPRASGVRSRVARAGGDVAPDPAVLVRSGD